MSTPNADPQMRTLRYSLNVTLDGCYDHNASIGDPEIHRRAAEHIARADAIIFGRVTYQMMETAWRSDPQSGKLPDWMDEWMEPFARTIDAAKKYVVTSTLQQADWNAEIVSGNELQATVRKLKEQPGDSLFVAGVQLAQALTELRLIDEYEFVVHPRIAGFGPTLFHGLSRPLDLELIERLDFTSGATVLRYKLMV